MIDRDRSLILFRIAQEAVRNVTKHSGGSRCEIGVELVKDRLILSISDNGRGFEPNGSVRTSGLGFISMAERARLVEGEFSLLSKPGGGTTIRVSVPLRT